MHKIVLIEPKSPDFHVYSKFGLPRLGLVILGTILKQNGYDVDIFIEDLAKIDFSIVRNANLVGLSTITSTAPRCYEIADKVKEMGIPVCMGGPHVTFMPDEALEHCDYVIRGEADENILDFADLALSNNGAKKFSDIPGLSFKMGHKVVHNDLVEHCTDLNKLPVPDFSIVKGSDGMNLTPVMTSRGCPYDCSFCSVTKMFGRRYRTRTIDSIIKELKSIKLIDNYVFFYDDNFTADFKRTKNLLKRMIAEKITPRWCAQVRVEIAKDKELMDLMAESNCHLCHIGLESINPETLKSYNKQQTLEDIKRCIKEFRKRRINLHGMFVFGSDSDSIETIRDTVNFTKKNHIDTVQFMILTPLPGTKFFNEINSANRLVTKEWKFYDGLHAVFNPKHMSVLQLQLETIKALTNFYSWFGIVKRVLKFHFFNAIMKTYGNRIIKKWRKNNVEFIRNLKNYTHDAIAKVKAHKGKIEPMNAKK